jgi:arabinose-5-phosphate isomerase
MIVPNPDTLTSQGYVRMIIEQAAEVLKIEADAIMGLIEKLDERFIHMVDWICQSTGRVIIAGIGKSGLIGRKIAATLNSTGTNAFFLHPVEAMHGDLGMVCKGDVFIALSNSGETDELNILIPSIRTVGCRVIAFTGAPHSTLAGLSDLVIDVGVHKEACPLGLAPTSSTTALLAMGDALAVTLIEKKQFKSSDFKKFHPGGKLGQRLAGNVDGIMLTGAKIPTVGIDANLREAVMVIDRFKLGVVLVVDSSNRLQGILTDGDVRHLMAMGSWNPDRVISGVMTRNPKHLATETPAYDALDLMEHHQITVLPITDNQKIVVGVLHLHDILGKGQFKFSGK